MTYSKKLPIIAGAIFIFVIIFCLFHGGTYENYSIYVAAITASASCFTGVNIWYLKKAQTENTYKLDMDCFEKKEKIELEHLEKVLQLQQKYKVTNNDIQQIEFNSDLDDLTRQSFNKVQDKLNQSAQEAQGQASDFQ